MTCDVLHALNVGRMGESLESTGPAHSRNRPYCDPSRLRTIAVSSRLRTLTIPLPRQARHGVLKVKLTITATGPRQAAQHVTLPIFRR